MFAKARGDQDFEETDISVSTTNDIEIWIMQKKQKLGLDYRVGNMVKFKASDTVYDWRKNISVRTKDLLNKEKEVYLALVYLFIHNNQINEAKASIRVIRAIGYNVPNFEKTYQNYSKMKELSVNEFSKKIKEFKDKIEFAERDLS